MRSLTYKGNIFSDIREDTLYKQVMQIRGTSWLCGTVQSECWRFPYSSWLNAECAATEKGEDFEFAVCIKKLAASNPVA